MASDDELERRLRALEDSEPFAVEKIREQVEFRDARIAELEAENERLLSRLEQTKSFANDAECRAEAAEARVAADAELIATYEAVLREMRGHRRLGDQSVGGWIDRLDFARDEHANAIDTARGGEKGE